MLITSLCRSGGAESQVFRLSTELKARSWEVCVVSLIKPAAYVRQLEEQNIEVHSLDMKPGVPDFRAVFRLRSLIQRFRPDILHCHMFHANLLGRITRLVCPIPLLICTAHGVQENSRKGGPSWHRELLYRATDNLAERTTIICNAAYERYVRVGAVARNKLQVIPNGIDSGVFAPSRERRTSIRHEFGIGSEFVWLAVGRLVIQKDYPTLFNALEQLPTHRFVVLIAGDGPLEADLRVECTRRRLNDKVRFCGAREDIVDLYNAADAFVMSSDSEGLPMALLEAASVGLPAVVTDVGGNSDIVVDGITGYIVPPSKPVQLAAELQRIMEASPESRESMSRAARRHCQQNYRIAAIIESWLDLYTECLSSVRVERDVSSAMYSS
jgi:glycosyltransferase involved in cell wall biosynthesis